MNILNEEELNTLSHEMVDVYNRLREKKGYIKDRLALTPSKEYKVAMHLWVLNKEGEFLIQKRSKTVRRFKSKYAPIAGGTESGEKTVDTAVRETYEELGLELEKEDLIYCGTFLKEDTYIDIYLACKDVKIEELVLQESEVEKAFFLSVEEYFEASKKGKSIPDNDFSFYVMLKSINSMMLNKERYEYLNEKINGKTDEDFQENTEDDKINVNFKGTIFES